MNQEEFLTKFFALFDSYFKSAEGKKWMEGYFKLLTPYKNIDYNKLYDIILAQWDKYTTAPRPCWLKEKLSVCFIQPQKPQMTQQEKTIEPLPKKYVQLKLKLQGLSGYNLTNFKGDI